MKLCFVIVYLVFCSNSIGGSQIEGLIWGSLYGDAFGGPYEFIPAKAHPLIREKRSLTLGEWKVLSKSVGLVRYNRKVTAYGVWEEKAAPGTITDDSRHKIIFYRAIKNGKVTGKRLAKRYVKFFELKNRYRYSALYRAWLKEFAYASYFIFKPNHPLALPSERIWGGKGTVSGQMIFPFMAILYPRNPVLAYKKTFSLNFFDQGTAKDYTSALIAGLSFALGRNRSWEQVKASIVHTDPYRYSEIPYIGREVAKSMTLIETLVKKANNNPDQLFQSLRKLFPGALWWESQTAFIVSLSFLEMAYQNKEPMSAFALVKGFGEDTDSYAQLIGAFIGAIEGIDIFDKGEIQMVQNRLWEDYKVDFNGIR
jgi:ADP-ribosylglycohydrolase